MSRKFKPGDMVEIIKVDNSGKYAQFALPGSVGTITRFIGINIKVKQGLIPRCWELKLANGIQASADENVLRLIPGGNESKQPGSWKELPWSPYRQKVS